MTKEVQKKYSNIHVVFSIWLESGQGERILSDKTWELLKAIATTGSLSSASRLMNISYRKAWGDLKKTEALLGFQLIEKHRGGASGGETHLSEEGMAFMEAYAGFLEEFDAAVQSSVIHFKRRLKGKPQK